MSTNYFLNKEEKKSVGEKKHRLDLDAYKGYIRVSFTACMQDREPYFTTDDRFHTHESHLLRALKQHHCGAEVYVFMPDHLHVIIMGETDDADVYQAMRKFKQYSGYWLSKN